MIYHLALADDWADSLASGRDYATSTLGISLEQQGFIHCSFADQVQRIADLFYRGRRDVVLLRIDPTLLTSPVRVEEADADAFPHVYGPLDLEAVLDARPWHSSRTGGWTYGSDRAGPPPCASLDPGPIPVTPARPSLPGGLPPPPLVPPGAGRGRPPRPVPTG